MQNLKDKQIFDQDVFNILYYFR